MKFPEFFIQKARETKKESKYVDFKEDSDITSARQWCEIIKDVVAMANSGGGAIVFGVSNYGKPLGVDSSKILEIDTALITDQIAKYTGEQFSDFEFEKIIRHEHMVPTLLINRASYPMIFIKPGTYDIGKGKQDRAFSQGTVYFRHGAKSEPGSTDDIRTFVDRKVAETKKFWISGIRKITKATEGHTVHLLPPDISATLDPSATPIQIVDNPNAPPYRLQTPDDTHPFRQKDLVKNFNEKVKSTRINSYDVQCLKRVYNLPSRPEFCYKPKYSSPQFSEAMVKWMITEYGNNSSFFKDARQKGRIRHKRRKNNISPKNPLLTMSSNQDRRQRTQNQKPNSSIVSPGVANIELL